MMGFGIAAVSLAACEAPVKYAIPYLNKPVDVDPSVPNYYASTYASGGDYCSIVVKTREGRPIKIEGNQYSTITQGGTSAEVQASVLSLYDSERLRFPITKDGKEVSWEALDKTVINSLRQSRNLRVISNTLLSPSTKAVIQEFVSTYGGEHIMYDPASSFALTEAHRENFGQAAVPSYDFSRADVIVSFGADFLGTWLSPVEFSKQYSKTRKIGAAKKNMSRHYQFESVMTVTGANADYRSPIRPSEEGMAVTALYNLIAGGNTTSVNTSAQAGNIQYLRKAAADLQKARGRSLVVSSSNDVAVQRMVNAINQALGNYGATIDINTPAYYRQGDDRRMAQFVQEAAKGSIEAVVFYDCNPVYDYAGGMALGKALEENRIRTKISTAQQLDETAVLCDFVAPDHNYLESWNDYEPKRGHFSLSQPVIRPIFNTRQAQESFLLWTSGTASPYLTYLQNRWQSGQFGQQSQIGNFQQFWDTALYTGIFVPGQPLDLTIGAGGRDEQIEGGPSTAQLPAGGAVATTGTRTPAASADTARVASAPVTTAPNALYRGSADSDARLIAGSYKSNPDQLELVMYQKVGLGVGRQANNPWLQELPDPITKATWDNYLSIPIDLATEWGIDGELTEGRSRKARLKVGNSPEIEVPVLIQPGQASGTVGLALGYGRMSAGKVAKGVGVNAYPLLPVVNGVTYYSVQQGVSVELTSDRYSIAQTQTHQTYMGRETILQDATLAEYQVNPKAGRFEPKIATAHGPKDPDSISLWDGHIYPNHHWAMAIDLNSCTGCSACTIACNVENNIPVVGKAEVLNRRDMHWMRIDRYYSSRSAVEGKEDLEKASANPEVTFQPMLCQHCNNAPCETVCPVAATTHSTEGINQMAYSRCIGTRYCANNCPYKVRRFNWFKYHDNEQFAGVNPQMNDELGKMVLNPDVTVRARGIMEKCTFCVQRIQVGKLQAKRDGRRPADGEIVTACASACPTDAITFGDLNDENSRIRQLMESESEGRAYSVLKEIGTRPNVYYLTKIRNKDLEETTA
ncbi:Formate dehydrogenase iron-sulfur subunit [Cesiribacter andamanensis AMV16]|uniref:Formate dehydrogenase iron-sulfur subunit n=2 Tax=Cesiribacter TaxID=1133570 RepID=M7NX70_9BACT|nr:Formate dehydrogenase iron-sulfur subunit [Cesiribacter andamanensis AMV16]